MLDGSNAALGSVPRQLFSEDCEDSGELWAEMFEQVISRHGLTIKHLGTGMMTGWFSNAIEMSHDIRVANLNSRIQKLLDIQGSEGNWDYDAYQFGLYNGMEAIASLVDGDRSPVFRDAPGEFISDRTAGCVFAHGTASVAAEEAYAGYEGYARLDVINGGWRDRESWLAAIKLAIRLEGTPGGKEFWQGKLASLENFLDWFSESREDGGIHSVASERGLADRQNRPDRPLDDVMGESASLRERGAAADQLVSGNDQPPTDETSECDPTDLNITCVERNTMDLRIISYGGKNYALQQKWEIDSIHKSQVTSKRSEWRDVTVLPFTVIEDEA